MVLVTLLTLEHDRPDGTDWRLVNRRPPRSEHACGTGRATEVGTKPGREALLLWRANYFLVGSALVATRRASRSTAASFSSVVMCE